MLDKKEYLMKFLANQITATTALSIEKVHIVKLKTINFDPFIHSSIQRKDDYDLKTHLLIFIHII